jgi:hypothetical protein
MRILSIVINPTVEVQFTRDEVARLVTASRNHYDYSCRELSAKAGQEGFSKNGVLTVIAYREYNAIDLDFRTLDLLSKLCESSECCFVDIRKKLRKAMELINKSTERIKL